MCGEWAGWMGWRHCNNAAPITSVAALIVAKQKENFKCDAAIFSLSGTLIAGALCGCANNQREVVINTR